MSICKLIKTLLREYMPKQSPILGMSGGDSFEIYFWSPDEDEEFHRTALNPPRKAGHGIAWAERPGNDAMFQEQWIPKAYRTPGTYSTRGLLDALTSKAQKELFMHEIWGHMYHGYKHDTGHPVMDGNEDGKRVTLGKRVENEQDFTDAWNELVDAYPNVVIRNWESGMTAKEIDHDE